MIDFNRDYYQLENSYLEDLTESEQRDITQFCEMYHIDLIAYNWTDENEKREKMYFFNDNLGGYTIDAVRKSLEK